MNSLNKIILGLDLGTDKCCITYQDSIGRPFIITDNKDYKISSIIGIMHNGILVGNEIDRNNIYDIPIISNLKRLIGLTASNSEAINIAKYHGWKIYDDIDDICIEINNVSHKLNDLMCILLKKIKNIIESNIGENYSLIITVPANFNEGQKNKILSYCNQVNIDCLRLIYEPCSAALTYINYFEKSDATLNETLDETLDETLKRILVFDFGAGTLDLAIVSCNYIIDDNEIEWLAKIESNIGDNHLGGIDIDIKLEEYISEKYSNFRELIKSKNESSKFIIEKIKIKLSNMYNKYSDSKMSVIERYYDISIIISIDEYFNLLDKYFSKRIIDLLDRLHGESINNESISKDEIDNILLIGGSCYNPWIKNKIESYYNKKINDYKLSISDHLETYKLDIRDIAVSLGATCVNKKRSINGNNLILTESLPLSIGIEMVNCKMCKILPKNTIIPCSAKQYFTTSENNQTTIEVKLYQGERDDIRDNYLLGSFKMDNLDPEPQGKVVIIVNISVTSDGLITIEGKVKNQDKFTKKLIINRYENTIDVNKINSNIKSYELNDIVFNTIMQKYYNLITILNKLQYNLLDNKTFENQSDVILNIINSFWSKLISLYKLMLQSDKVKENINQLTKFINYIENKISDKTLLDLSNFKTYDLTDDNLIIDKLTKLIKYLEKNLQHLISSYHNMTDTTNTTEDNKYDTLCDDNTNLPSLNSILNPTEILESKDIELINEINLELNNQNQNMNNIDYIKQIKDLIKLIVNNIDDLEMSDINKLLLLEIIDKYEIYIDLLLNNNVDNFNGQNILDNIQNLCIKIHDINDEQFLLKLQYDIESIDPNNLSIYISSFELFLNYFN